MGNERSQQPPRVIGLVKARLVSVNPDCFKLDLCFLMICFKIIVEIVKFTVTKFGRPIF